MITNQNLGQKGLSLTFCYGSKLIVRNPKSRLKFIKDVIDSLASESKAIVGADKKNNTPRRNKIVCTWIEITDFQTPDKAPNTTRYLLNILKIHWTSYLVILYIHRASTKSY